MWWEYVIAAAVAALIIYAFCVWVRTQTGWLSRRTDRTAESMYRQYAGSRREQRKATQRLARGWKDDDE